MTLIRTTLRRARLAREIARYPYWSAVKFATGGMLSPAVYATIFRTVRERCDPSLPFIEIGAAGGSATVAIARGLGSGGTVLAVEKAEGGSRIDYGGYSENVARLNRNLSRWGVQERVDLFTRPLDDLSWQDLLDQTAATQIGGMMHDADGQIDRDFRNAWPVLTPHALIIIDDYSPSAHYRPISDRYPDGGTKTVVTYALLNKFIEWGLFLPLLQKGMTVFGIKPADGSISSFDQDECDALKESVMEERERVLGGSTP